MTQPEWEQRLEDLWASFDDYAEDDFRAKLDELARELPPDVAAFERAGAFDSTGHEDKAIPLYREALKRGLEDPRRRRAVIQLASSLRNIGEAEESVRLLEAERERTSDELDDAVDAFLALALIDTRREREAASLLLTALARHLPRYQRSAASYAKSLLQETSAG